jgi:hypothetical protein
VERGESGRAAGVRGRNRSSAIRIRASPEIEGINNKMVVRRETPANCRLGRRALWGRFVVGVLASHPRVELPFQTQLTKAIPFQCSRSEFQQRAFLGSCLPLVLCRLDRQAILFRMSFIL